MRSLIDFSEMIKKFPMFIYYINGAKNRIKNEDLKFIIEIVRLKSDCYHNKFITENDKNDFFKYLDVFIRKYCLAKKYYNQWQKFLIFNKPAKNQYDLEFNSISKETPNVIKIIDHRNRSLYLFTQRDMYKLIEANLFNSYVYDSIPNPLFLKNPYNNTRISKRNLIAIDRQLQKPPIVWELYKKSNYNIHLFRITNYNYLDKECISSYLGGLSDEDIEFYVMDILEVHKIRPNSYCIECLKNPSIYRTKKMLKVLTNWLRFLKFNTDFETSDLKTILIAIKKECTIHTDFSKAKNFLENISISKERLDENGVFIFNSPLNSSTQLIGKRFGLYSIHERRNLN